MVSAGSYSDHRPKGHVAHRLQGIVVGTRESPADNAAGRAVRGAGANPVRLQDGAQSPLGSDGIAADELAVAEGHAAEILRPRAILGRVDHDVADPLRSHLLRLRGKAEVGVDL